MASEQAPYLLANSHEPAARRLSLLSELFDPITDRILTRIGIRSGWRCWEIGTGNGSTAEQLARRVGPHGRVLATDIDLTALQNAVVPHCEFLRHDIVRDAPLTERREAVIVRLRSCLSDSGTLFLEDADPALQPLACPDAVSQMHLANDVRAGFRRLLAARGADLAFGFLSGLSPSYAIASILT